MASKTYVTKGYSTYTDIPARRGGYDHGPKISGNEYIVDTKTIEKVHAPGARFKEFAGSPSKVELLKEYVHSPTMSSGPKYAPINHIDDHGPIYGQNYVVNYENLSPPKYQRQNTISEPHSPKKDLFSKPTHDYPSGTNKSWLSAGPPATHHPLTNPTNNINEALGLLEESVYYSPRADPRRRGVLDDLSTRAQPIEPQRRYARPAFVSKHNDARHNYNNRASAVDSYEDVRRFGNEAHVLARNGVFNI
nr:DNA-directed RNA polymerase II subunit RPB1-like [Tanacetum cinerariifolium]